MAGNNISIAFRFTGDASELNKLIQSSDGLKKALEGNFQQAEKLKTSLINFAALSKSIDAVSGAVNSLAGTMQGLANAYAVQQQAETQLEVTMRNRMNATQAEIQSIKDLCAAQQQLGVIGDEVQLAGAQELATYLEKKRSLEQLIPLMNDMLVQQYGLNATSENAAAIAAQLGKALNGNANILERQGYKLTANQKKLIETGTESEKVRAIFEAVSAQVGGMNAEMAKTDAGKMKQLSNTLGDLKEKMGALIQGILPYVTIVAQMTTAVGGVVKLTAAFKSLTAVTKIFTVTTTLSSKAAGALGATMIKVGTSMETATTAVKVATVALKALMKATIVFGIIQGVMWAVDKLTGSTDKATSSMQGLNKESSKAKEISESLREQLAAEASAYETAKLKISTYLTKIQEFQGSEVESKKLVKELNSEFGERLGKCNSLSSWYDKLIKKSGDYCEAMRLEARVSELTRRQQMATEAIVSLKYNPDGSEKTYEKGEGAYARYHKFDGEWYELKDTYPAKEAYNSVMPGWAQKIDPLKEAYNTPKPEWFKVDEETAKNIVAVENKYPGDVTKGYDIRETIQYKDTQQIKELEALKASIDKDLIETEIAKTKLNEAIKTPDEPGTSENKIPIYRKNAANAPEYQENIDYLNKELDKYNPKNPEHLKKIDAINVEIDEWQKLYDRVKKRPTGGATSKNNTPIYRKDAANELEWQENISVLEAQRQLLGDDPAALERKAAINKEIKEWQARLDRSRKAGEVPEFFENLWAKTLSKEQLRQDLPDDVFVSSTYGSTRLPDGARLGGVEDKRASYANARADVSQLQSDFDLGIKGADQVKAELEEINALLESFGLKPLEINVNGESIKKLEEYKQSMSDWGSLVSGISSAFGNLGNAIEGTTGKILQMASATLSAIAQTLPQIASLIAARKAEAYVEGGAQAMKLPPPANFIAIAAIASTLTGFFASFAGKFASGGIVGGGMPSGDRKVAFVNSREMILTVGHQERLWALLNGQVSAGSRSITGAGLSKEVIIPDVRISGRDMVLVFNKELRHQSRR